MFGKYEKQKALELMQYGMVVGDVHTDAKHSRALSCLMRGVLIFMATFGMIDSVMSAFSISYNKVLVFTILLVVSVLAAFMYYNKICFYLGYFAFMILLMIELIRYNRYINSGYQAVLNIIHKEYSDYYDLGITRDAVEWLPNRYVTITLFLIFIGFALAILLNVVISGYMNVVETVLLTAPFVEVALFIGKMPHVLPLGMLFAVYIAVGCLQCSQNARTQVKLKKNKEYVRRERKKSVTYFYQGSGAAVVYIAGIGLLLSIVMLLILRPMQVVEDKERTSKSEVREVIDDKVKIFVHTGFSGFFDRYTGAGGLSSGRLGGVSSVRPDFQTDLIVRFVPYTLDTVYLRSFIGTEYIENRWTSHVILLREEGLASLVLNPIDVDRYENEFSVRSDATATMEIEAVDAMASTLLLPYTSFRRDARQGGRFTVVTYSPYFRDHAPMVAPMDETYKPYVEDACLELTDAQRSYLTLWCEENGVVLPEVDLETLEPEERLEMTMQLASQIRNIFLEKYPYTMSPGATPRNADFVEHFLMTQKRGYCSHFASAAALLMRSLSIPARYIEGYSIPNSLVAEGEVDEEERRADWYSGASEIEVDNVVRVEVNDSYAHAWTEIFVDGYGWIPYEFTPPSFEEDEMTRGSFFARLFRGLFNSVNINADEANDGLLDGEDGMDEFAEGFQLSSVSIFFPIVLFLAAVALAALLLLLVRFVRQKIALLLLWKREEYERIVVLYYRRLLSCVMRKAAASGPYPMPSEVLVLLTTLLPSRGEENQKLIRFAERAAFSAEKPTEVETREFVSEVKLLTKELRRQKS